VIAAYQQVDSYRGAAEICGTTHKTVKRIVTAALSGEQPARRPRDRNYDNVAELVRDSVAKSHGLISAKRLLPVAVAAGYGRIGPELPAVGRGGETPPAADASSGSPSGGSTTTSTRGKPPTGTPAGGSVDEPRGVAEAQSSHTSTLVGWWSQGDSSRTLHHPWRQPCGPTGRCSSSLSFKIILPQKPFREHSPGSPPAR
jgi:hypothetical protein